MARRASWSLFALGLAALPARAGDGLVGSYWGGFKEFWVGAVQRQNGVILALLGFGVVCIFIITRSKAKK